jgi:hypothetical protein
MLSNYLRRPCLSHDTTQAPRRLVLRSMFAGRLHLLPYVQNMDPRVPKFLPLQLNSSIPSLHEIEARALVSHAVKYSYVDVGARAAQRAPAAPRANRHSLDDIITKLKEENARDAQREPATDCRSTLHLDSEDDSNAETNDCHERLSDLTWSEYTNLYTVYFSSGSSASHTRGPQSGGALCRRPRHSDCGYGT